MVEHQISIALPPDDREQAEQLRQSDFPDMSRAAFYRALLRRGLRRAKKERARQKFQRPNGGAG